MANLVSEKQVERVETPACHYDEGAIFPEYPLADQVARRVLASGEPASPEEAAIVRQALSDFPRVPDGEGGDAPSPDLLAEDYKQGFRNGYLGQSANPFPDNPVRYDSYGDGFCDGRMARKQDKEQGCYDWQKGVL